MSNLLQDKVFVFAQNPTPSDSEIYFLDMAANAAELTGAKNYETVKHGENYDLYKADSNSGQKFIKLSLDPSYDFYKDPEPPNGPKTFKIIQFDAGIPVVAKIEDAISGQNLVEIGESALNFGWKNVVEAIVQNSQTSSPRTLKQHLKDLYKKTSLEEDENLRTLIETNSTNYQLVKSGILELKQEVQTLYKPWYSAETLIHGNLSADNIFFTKDRAAFSSWGSSYSGHLFLELAALKMNLDFPADLEYNMFLALKESAGVSQSWEDYNQCKIFVSSYKFLECVYSFIKETFLFEGERKNELLKLSSYFCRNLGSFSKLSGFKKHQDELLKLFSSPVV